MSPAGKAQCFAVLRGETDQRLNVVYFASGHQALIAKLAAHPRCISLGKVVGECGFGVLPPGNSYLKEGGVRFLRATELGPDNVVDWNACLRAPSEFARHNRATLKIGDVLIAVKGATIASEKSVCTVTELSEHTIINGSIFRFQPVGDTSAAFLLEVLSAGFMRQQMKGALIQNNAVDYLSKGVLDSLLFPLPPRREQEKLIVAMDAARAARRAKRAEADALLAGMDECVLQILGINIPARNTRTVFAVRYKEISRHQMGVSLYAPDLRDFIGALAGTRYPARRLGDEVILNPPTSTDELEADTPVSFIPMEAVAESAEGSVSLKSRPLAEVSKGYTPFNEGDVLWAKITPCMENGKSCVAKGLSNGVGFGSTEFHVLRPSSERVLADYLHSFLSLACFRRVARYAFTGSAGHQRVPEQFLAELPFPVPPISVQEKIVREAEERRMQARRLRQQAESDWQRAKAEFEAALLGKG